MVVALPELGRSPLCPLPRLSGPSWSPFIAEVITKGPSVCISGKHMKCVAEQLVLHK